MIRSWLSGSWIGQSVCQADELRGVRASIESHHGTATTCRPERSSSGPIVQEATESIGESWRIVGRDEVAAYSVFDDVGHPAGCRGDDWQPGRHGFDHTGLDAVAVCRQHKQVGLPEQAQQIRAVHRNVAMNDHARFGLDRCPSDDVKICSIMESQIAKDVEQRSTAAASEATVDGEDPYPIR